MLPTGIEGICKGIERGFLSPALSSFFLLDYRLTAWVREREGEEDGLVGSAFDQCRVLEEKT